jgi:hypothetical protein
MNKQKQADLLGGEDASAAANGQPAKGRTQDQELRAIAAVLRILERVPEPAKGRVVRYLAERYQEAAQPTPADLDRRGI